MPYKPKKIKLKPKPKKSKPKPNNKKIKRNKIKPISVNMKTTYTVPRR